MRAAATRTLVIVTACALALAISGPPRGALASTATTTGIVASAASGTPLDEIQFDATVAPVATGGTLEWSLDGSVAASTPLTEDGTATWVSHFAAGTHTVTAAFSGDGHLDPSTSEPIEVAIRLVPTATTVAVRPNPANAGSPATITARVSPAPSPGAGHIAWTIDDEASGITELDLDGSASLGLRWADPDKHTVIATFVEGNIWANSESDPATVTVSPVAFSVAASPIDPTTLVGTSVLRVSVTPNPKSGTVKVYADSTMVATSPLGHDGTAMSSVPVGEGTNTYRVDFTPSGATHVAASATATIEGRNLRPTLTLTTNRTTAVSGESLVAFTVSPDSNLDEGTTILYDTYGGMTTALGVASVTTDEDGTAWILRVRLVGIGVHRVRAMFSGGPTLASSASNSLDISVARDIAVAASGVGRSYATFYPYKDGYRDTVAIGGIPGERVSVAVKVYSSRGTRVRFWSLAPRLTQWTINWNGRNASGYRVAAGRYRIVQVVRDTLGHTKAYTSYTTISNKRLYWYSGSSTRYADTGAFSWTEEQDASASYSEETPRAIDLYGGYCSYDDTSGQDVCGIAFGWYQFTLPTAAMYSSIRFSVDGFSWENMGTGYLGLANYATESVDGVRAIGYSWDWYSTPSLSPTGHVNSSRVVTAYVWAQGEVWDASGSIEYQRVRLTYRYALLR